MVEIKDETEEPVKRVFTNFRDWETLTVAVAVVYSNIFTVIS